jgi:hypothetical protein
MIVNAPSEVVLEEEHIARGTPGFSELPSIPGVVPGANESDALLPPPVMVRYHQPQGRKSIYACVRHEVLTAVLAMLKRSSQRVCLQTMPHSFASSVIPLRYVGHAASNVSRNAVCCRLCRERQ